MIELLNGQMTEPLLPILINFIFFVVCVMDEAYFALATDVVKEHSRTGICIECK